MTKQRRYHAHPTGILAITHNGYGFVKTAEGEFFIPQGNIRNAMDGDTVEIRRMPQADQRNRSSKQLAPRVFRDSQSGTKEAPVGLVLRVLQRAHEVVVGRFEQAEVFGVVIPEDQRISHDIFIAPGAQGDAQDGDLVICRITSYPSRYEPAQGIVEEVLGPQGKQGLDLEMIVRRHGLETGFSEGALQEAKAAKLSIEDALKEPGRRDLRSRLIVTIDPADAKDFDDALSLEWRQGQAVLGVHIADVSHYVSWDSSLDLDARRRGTSVYLPGRVIPMLPEELCNDLCSLKPREDRLAFTVEMMLRGDASVERVDFFPSVICSAARLSYEGVQQVLEGESPVLGVDSELEPLLKDLDRIAQKRRKLRTGRGALDFDLPELKVQVDQEGAPYALSQRESTRATSLVEEAMLMANEAVASYLLQAPSVGTASCKKDASGRKKNTSAPAKGGSGHRKGGPQASEEQPQPAPAIYRVHDEPDGSRLEELLPILANLGYDTLNLDGSPRSLQALIAETQGRRDKVVIVSLLLRSMKQARYQDTWTGHFGLASPAYTHFTSPIRRYPDLLAHRLLKQRLQEAGSLGRSLQEPDSAPEDMQNQLAWLAEHSSAMEREAEQASLDATKLKACEYMESFVGERFSGVISGLGLQGIYVQLDNGVEGMIPARLLPESFTFDEAHLTMTGEQTGTVYSLGKRMHVVLENVDLALCRIDFSPLD